MFNRKNLGGILLSVSILLGVLMLVGAYMWVQDKANMILGVFVLILYGTGQWLTVAYWQRIQSDWEETGEILGRLQKSVTDIPNALETNLKAIAARLTENQQQALANLQGEVNEGARLTLEKGAGLIGESLDKNLRNPIAALEATLAAWRSHAEAQSAAAKAFGEELAKSQRESAEHAKALAASVTGELKSQSAAVASEIKSHSASVSAEIKTQTSAMSAELKALAASGVKAGQDSQAAWASRAAEIQNGWENQVQRLQESVLDAVGREAGKLGASLAATAGDLLNRIEALQSSQAAGQADVLEQALAGAEAQTKAMGQAAKTFEEGLTAIREASLRLIQDLEEKSAESQAKLLDEQTKVIAAIAAAQSRAQGESAKTLEAQGQLGLEVAGKVFDLAEQMRHGAKDVQELAHIAQVNQTEMQAGVGMLNAGLASILERLEKQAAAGEGQEAFLSELGRALASFQERASEVLVENAMKTQEILMEVLQQADRKDAASSNMVSVS